MIITRRSLFGFLAAPAIIRVADLMPVRALFVPPTYRVLSVGQSNGFVYDVRHYSPEQTRAAARWLADAFGFSCHGETSGVPTDPRAYADALSRVSEQGS